MLAVSNLELPVLLVERRDGETAEQLLEFLSTHYTARPDKQPGPIYRIGASYLYCGKRFSRVVSCAPELTLRMIFEPHGRSTIARLRLDAPLRLMGPDGKSIEIDESEIAEENE